MYQDLNGNYEYSEYLGGVNNHLRRMLQSIHEGKYLHNVPDINLQCDETIEDWDDLESCIYSSINSDKLELSDGAITQSETVLDKSSEFNYNYPPPNSPVKGYEDDQPMSLLHNQYVNSLLQMWRDSQESESGMQEVSENSDGYSLPSDDPPSSQDSCTSSGDQADEYSSEMQLERENSGQSNINTDEVYNSVSSFPVGTEQMHDMPVSQSSSRSTSPAMMETLSHFRQNFTNLRSVSPIIVRSPSPISPRSSSPRFLRSPSPLEYLDHSISSLPQDDSIDLVFYEDRYILRTHSPVSTGSVDHQVPDVNMEFQQAVSDSEEFPSFRSYSRGRAQNSCQDQIVPEFNEE